MDPNSNPSQVNMQQPVFVSPAPVSADPAPQRRKLTSLIIAAASLLILLGAGGLWLWANSAKIQYAQAVPAYETRAKAAYDYFGQLKDRLTHGPDIKQKFDQTIASAPKAPKLLGMSLAPADKTKRVSNLTNALQKFKTAYVGAADISIYSEKALPIMAGASGSISTPSDMERMKPKLERAKNSLDALTPPAPVKKFHNETLDAYTAVINDIDTALKALQKGETATYSSSIQKLAADAKKVSPNTAKQKLEAQFVTTYGQADAAYGELQKQLGIK